MTAAKLRSNSWFLARFGDGETGVQFSNSSCSSLLVPGFAPGLAIDLELKPAERFAHGAHDWAQPRLTAREMAMLRLINHVTDLPDWQIRVLKPDESEAIAALRQEALTNLTGPLISPRTWEWCLAELRDKAAVFKETGLIAVLDSASCVIKSDVLVSRGVLDQLRTGIASLLAEMSPGQESPDLHRVPEHSSSDRIVDLVDPALFPLIYGRTKVLTERGALDLVNALASIGQGTTAPPPTREPVSQDELSKSMLEYGSPWEHWTLARPYRYSHHSRWLPCEVSFTGEPGTTSVRITSYINNLHPISQRSLYRTIEEAISLSIKPWNEVLVRRDRPRIPPRIRCYGVPWLPPYPEWAYELPAIEKGKMSEESRQEAKRMVKQFLTIPNYYTNTPGFRGFRDSDLESRGGLERAMKRKHELLKYGWVHPEPGDAFSYAEWKAGKGGRAVVPMRGRHGCLILRQPEHEFYTTSLQDTFRERGLQVVVKLTTIELAPDNPYFLGTSWHIDGLLNEHIVASSILCISSHNTTPGSLSYRVEADLDPGEHAYEPRQRAELAAVLDLPSPSYLGADGGGGAALQDLGRVFLPEGRLIAVPNVLQRRMEPFALEDAACGRGYKRFLTLYLVDPHYRVCSTQNVPPQQHMWWWQAAGGGSLVASWAARGFPPEVVECISREVGEWPIGMEEARGIRKARIHEEVVGNAAVQMGVQGYQFSWD